MRCQPLMILLTLLGLLASLAVAGDRDGPDLRPILARSQQPFELIGATPDAGKAARDTVYLLGGPDRLDGRFEDHNGVPDWQGWTSRDFTFVPETRWQISDFNAAGLNGHPAGNLAMWCGTYFGENPGYGNDWNASLVWTGDAPTPGEPVTVAIAAFLNHDVEQGWDFLYLEVARADEWETLASYDGRGENLAVDETCVVAPEDYADGGIRLRWRFESDGAASDEDGEIDTDGACQIDDITVQLDGVTATFDDFEAGSPVHWTEVLLPGVGDFAQIYPILLDVDPCQSNISPQVAFLDDGVVVPGTGGTECITWCYGHGGYCVNFTGGLMGPDFTIHNGILSPPVALAAGSDGLQMEWDLWSHFPFNEPTWTGHYSQWRIRSTASEDAADLEAAEWVNRAFIALTEEMRYLRRIERVEDLLVPGARHVQLSLEVDQFLLWGWDRDPTPAPYFDNVAIKAFAMGGPTLRAQTIDLAQDTFPERGDLDHEVASNNHCRFDMARNISPASHLRNDPGDSLVVTAAPRQGASLTGPPRMIVSMHPNPVFDDVRVLPPGFAVSPGGLIKGTVLGSPVGGLAIDRYSFDLPDTGFFFPGDEIHYFFEAHDERDGDLGLTRLPADTSGFDRYLGSQIYDTPFPPEFTVRALPSIRDLDYPADQPDVLFWFDGDDREEFYRWYVSLANSGLDDDHDFDTYVTRGAGAGVGNGLGGRATSAVLAEYDVLLYTSDVLAAYTLSNGDHAGDPSQDLQVLSNWFGQGGKNAFFTGDNLVSSLMAAGAAGQAFVNTYFGVALVDPCVREYIGNQVTPTVAMLPGNGVVVRVDEFIAQGGCPSLNSFDALEAVGSTTRIAEYTDPNGEGGIFPYAPMTMHLNQYDDARVVLLNQAFGLIGSPPGWEPPIGYGPVNARTVVLMDVLEVLDYYWFGAPIAAPDTPASLAVSAGPNPFNPRTVIKLDLPRAARTQVKLYDLRGALVRTLCDEQLAAGRHELTWAGEDQQGRQAASGIYFYEVKAAGETRLGKLTLLK